MIGDNNSTQQQEETSFSTTIPLTHFLNDKWVLYNHLPCDKNWTLSGYTVIMKDIDTMEKVISLNENVSENIIKYSMLFMMRSGINPIWEDAKNANGGNFSYKVVNKHVYEVWKLMVYSLCGETLCTDAKYNQYINGITISPKKNFCILKVWLNTMTVQDPNIIIQIQNLTRHGAIFKRHGADT